jgi:hypothetical protein
VYVLCVCVCVCVCVCWCVLVCVCAYVSVCDTGVMACAHVLIAACGAGPLPIEVDEPSVRWPVAASASRPPESARQYSAVKCCCCALHLVCLHFRNCTWPSPPFGCAHSFVLAEELSNDIVQCADSERRKGDIWKRTPNKTRVKRR